MRTSLRFPYPTMASGGKKAAPLGESGGAGQLVVVAVLEMALRGEVVVDRGMDGGELLQCSHPPEPQHRPLASSERQVGVFRSVVEPPTHLAIVTATEVLQRGTIGSQAVGHNGLGAAVPSDLPPGNALALM